MDGKLCYTRRWEAEDSHISGEQRTRELLGCTMGGVESYLSFTVESGEQFPDGWLPTLDTSLKVGSDNTIKYRFYEKETCSQKTVQRRTAMEENVKLKIVSNDLVRRLCNSMEELGSEEMKRIIDGYGQKLLSSGYSLEQSRRIVVNGIKGYEGRKRRCEAQGRKLKRTAKESMDDRSKKTLLGRSNWFKGRKKIDYYKNNGGRRTGNKDENNDGREEHLNQKSVLFVEHTRNGELGAKLRGVIARLAPLMGFSVKVVERAGGALKNQFPQSSLWEGAPCGRPSFVTCNQGSEMIAPCTRKSLVYENICSKCNEGAGGKEEVMGGGDPSIPSIYVGETARSIQERSLEHWAAARGSKKAREGSHMAKHVEQVHKGEEPQFMMRVVQFHRSALSRQTAEAVRIRRRGGEGAVLNSRSEFNRCFIPRLRLIEEEELEEREQMEKMEEEEIREELQNREEQWAKSKNTMRSRENRSKAKMGSKSHKRAGKGGEQGAENGLRPTKKKRYEFEIVEEGWGEHKTRAKTTVGGVRNDEEPGKEGIKDVRSWEQPETGDTPEGECGSQEHPPTLEETPDTTLSPPQGVSNHPGAKTRPPTKPKGGGTVTICDYFQSGEILLAKLTKV